MSTTNTEKAPRLVKATEVATRDERRQAETIERKQREKRRIAELVERSAARARGPRDARAVFDALFRNPTPA